MPRGCGTWGHEWVVALAVLVQQVDPMTWEVFSNSIVFVLGVWGDAACGDRQGTPVPSAVSPAGAEAAWGWVTRKVAAPSVLCAPSSLAAPHHQVQRRFPSVLSSKKMCLHQAARHGTVESSAKKRPLQKKRISLPLLPSIPIHSIIPTQNMWDLAQLPPPRADCALFIHYTYMLFNVLFIFFKSSQRIFC